jgi:hypothetical protein
LEVKVALAGRLLKAVYITGDFFVAENAVAALEASLRWHSSAPEAIAATLQSIYARRRDELSMIPSAALIETIQLAVQKALTAEAREHASPYGCFVDPEAAHV